MQSSKLRSWLKALISTNKVGNIEDEACLDDFMAQLHKATVMSKACRKEYELVRKYKESVEHKGRRVE